MKILIVQNIARECPGLIEEVLNERNFEFDTIDLSKNQPFPNPSKYPAVFVLGGPDSANDRTLKMLNELQRIKEILAAKIPYFGVCLGMQALVKAPGGEVYANPVKEVGCKDSNGDYYEVDLTEEVISDSIFKGIKSPFKIFQLHGETVALKNGMKLLGIGEHCKHQLVKVGNNAYGIQGHLEVTGQVLEKWLAEDSMFDNYDKNSIMKDFKSIKNEYHNNGIQLINNFLDVAEQSEKRIGKIPNLTI